ncbi:cGMP-dependent protein kinase type I [Candidatus Desulfarcum epimagneticum]|uniref:cGMP-dependent protein kinase type I n=1 Tax=uncultured Desulfobacteraceae bacterium TaxID=218296 RepID=A0A484HEV4_9BACT|nr:cGMP-dependent protein kinase type I [uncultured Desulfobacteraceae bacterium]
MKSDALSFKPFIFQFSEGDVRNVARVFQLLEGEKISIRWTQGKEYLYPVTGRTIVRDSGGAETALEAAPGKDAPFRMPERVEPIEIFADTEAILYHVDEEKLDDLIFWSELKRVIDEKGMGLNSRIDKLSESPVFSGLSPRAVCETVNALKVREVSAGEEVIKQFDPGDVFYIIDSGVAEVWVAEFVGDESKKVCDLRAGHGFGEDALVSGKPRNATVKMKTGGKLLTLEKDDYIRLISSASLFEVGPEEAREKTSQGVELLDIRFEEENEEAHIPGSILIPLHQLRQRFGELDQGKDYIVYCRSGKRSAAGAAFLSKMDFNAVSMKGGIKGWPYKKEGIAADMDVD